MIESLDWDTHEHLHDEKTSDWYWSLGIISVSLAILSIILSNIILAILILLAAFVVGLHATKSPRIIRISLFEKGILIHKHWYSYKFLDSFWVEDTHEHYLILKSKKFFAPFIVIPINIMDVHPDDIRVFLRQYLPEKEHRESMLHKAMEYLGI